MTAKIHYTRNDRLPQLGWLARLDLARGDLVVTHGSSVECRDEWLVEGVWDGDFAAGDFHRCDHLFGSGVRLHEGRVHFVPSCALVDRLLYGLDGDELIVSNSLLILLAATGARLDPRHDYRAEARAIMRGISSYAPEFHLIHPRIERLYQLYHRQLVVANGAVATRIEPPPREFTSFEDYRGAMRERIAAIVANGRDPARRVPLAEFGTLSSGYDSPAVASFVREFGVRRYFSYRGAWQGERSEADSAPIAAALGVEPIWLGGTGGDRVEDARYLYASNPLGFQLPLLEIAEHVERNGAPAMLFTGYHGGVVWGLNADEIYGSAEMRRRDLSGLDLSELRLKSGFFNVAVPFLFARSTPSIRAVSRSADMEPWRTHNGYDRPIARRLVESAGVERRLFGIHKLGLFGGGVRPVAPALRERFGRWARRVYGMSRPRLLAQLAADKLGAQLLRRVARALPSKGGVGRLRQRMLERVWRLVDGESLLGRRVNMRVALYLWAVDELVAEIAAGLGTSSGASARHSACSETRHAVAPAPLPSARHSS
jgi:hypothetical protein